MKIFRVEHSKGGFGPYNAQMKVLNEYVLETMGVSDEADDLFLEYNSVINDFDLRTQPAPHHDGELAEQFYTHVLNCSLAKSEWHFGFGAIEHLNNWFSESARVKLSLLGYVVSVYEVDIDNVFVSPHQALFHRPSANLVETLKKF